MSKTNYYDETFAFQCNDCFCQMYTPKILWKSICLCTIYLALISISVIRSKIFNNCQKDNSLRDPQLAE